MCSVKSCSLIVEEYNWYLNNCVEIVLNFLVFWCFEVCHTAEQWLLDFSTELEAAFAVCVFVGFFLKCRRNRTMT